MSADSDGLDRANSSFPRSLRTLSSFHALDMHIGSRPAAASWWRKRRRAHRLDERSLGVWGGSGYKSGGRFLSRSSPLLPFAGNASLCLAYNPPSLHLKSRKISFQPLCSCPAPDPVPRCRLNNQSRGGGGRNLPVHRLLLHCSRIMLNRRGPDPWDHSPPER